MAIRTHQPLWLLKSGEGSRGGVIIGHTKSGKPIYRSYMDQHREGMSDWSAVDHWDAAEAHDNHGAASGDKGQANIAKMHSDAAQRLVGVVEQLKPSRPRRSSKKPRLSLEERKAAEAARNVNTSESTKRLFGPHAHKKSD